MRRLNSLPALFACLLPLAQAETPTTKPGVAIVEPAVDDRILVGAEFVVTVRITVPKGSEPPTRVYADFHRGKVLAGQFASYPAKLKKVGDEEFECQVRVESPKSPGDYTLKVSAHDKLVRETDPRTALEFRRDGDDTWVLKAPVDD